MIWLKAQQSMQPAHGAKLKRQHLVCSMFDFRLPTIAYVKSNSARLNGFAGRSFLWFIWIDKAYRNDTGLYMHECTHFKQWKKHKLLHLLRYQFSASYRYNMELEAYRKQLVYSTNRAKDAELFAMFIMTRYRLHKLLLTRESVKRKLLS